MKRKIALLLITGICLANTVPCFASPSMKVSVSSSSVRPVPFKQCVCYKIWGDRLVL